MRTERTSDNGTEAKTGRTAWRTAWEGLRLVFHLLLPHRCAICRRVLADGEEGICISCNINLPRTYCHLTRDNAAERIFWGRLGVERASAYIYYRKGSTSRRLLHLLKYEGRKDLGDVMGRFMAAELKADGFFEGIDIIVPVPLHRRKERARGYNQSTCLAKGISRVTGIPVDLASVVRERYTESQTKKTTYERWENTDGVFRLLRPERFADRHVLLVDDVLTTGATTIACADAFSAVDGIRISVLTLALAGD